MKHLIYTLFTLTILTVYSCATPRHTTQLVRDIQRDTIYMTSQRYDSIYIYQDRLLDRSKDTVYLKDVSVEYRYKLLRDTVKVIQRDSIPYEVVRIETKEITRPLTLFDKICRMCFFFLTGVLFVQFVRFVFKLKKSIYV